MEFTETKDNIQSECMWEWKWERMRSKLSDQTCTGLWGEKIRMK